MSLNIHSQDTTNFTILYCLDLQLQSSINKIITNTHNYSLQTYPLHLMLGVNNVFINALSNFYSRDVLNIELYSLEGGYMIPFGQNIYIPLSVGYYIINEYISETSQIIHFQGPSFTLGLLWKYPPIAIGLNYSTLCEIEFTAGFSFDSGRIYKREK